MLIQKLDNLKKTDVLYTGGWFLNVFVFEELRKIKENKKSIRFKKTLTYIEFKNCKVVERRVRECKATIPTDKILYSKIPYFTTKKEVIEYFLEVMNKELEEAREKLEKLPILIDEFKNAFKGILEDNVNANKK